MEFIGWAFCQEALAPRRNTLKGQMTAQNNAILCLDTFSQNFFHQGTLFTWNALVRNGVPTPPDGSKTSQ